MPPVALAVSALDPDAPGLARYARWLGVDTLESLGEHETLYVAGTGPFAGLSFKVEGLQPTGSFKDRGSATLVGRLSELAVGHVVEDSSGNAGASLAAYCARAGIAVRLFVPESAPVAKLRQAAVHGAEIVRVPGPREAASAAAIEAAETSGEVYASHLWNPYFTRGMSTFAFELWEQRDQEAPDAVVIPVGAGTLFLGAYQGFLSLREAGLAARVPRMFGVQVEAFAPLARASESGSKQAANVAPATSAADGILVANPPNAPAVLEAARASGGAIIAVSETALWDAHGLLGVRGLFVEPTSAVAAAGALVLRSAGALVSDAETVVVLTGHGLKSAASRPGSG